MLRFDIFNFTNSPNRKCGVDRSAGCGLAGRVRKLEDPIGVDAKRNSICGISASRYKKQEWQLQARRIGDQRVQRSITVLVDSVDTATYVLNALKMKSREIFSVAFEGTQFSATRHRDMSTQPVTQSRVALANVQWVGVCGRFSPCPSKVT
ncbi:MAG: hypothetical protein WBV39_15725 [Rudaea sp.]